jgi:hypothetical protein
MKTATLFRSCRHFHELLLAGSLAAVAMPSGAHEYYTPNFTVVHPWAEATQPDATQAPVFFVLESIAKEDRLLRAFTPLAETVEFRAGDDAGQLPLAEFLIPVAEKVEYLPGKAHLLLKGLKAPLQWYRSYQMTLVFEKAGLVNVMISIGAH